MDSDNTTDTYEQGGPYDPCQNPPVSHGGRCPRCGYCPCCGRGGRWYYPTLYPTWPPSYPWGWYGTGDTIPLNITITCGVDTSCR